LIEYGTNIYNELLDSKDDYLKNKILIDYSTYFNSKDTCFPIEYYIETKKYKNHKVLIKKKKKKKKKK